MQENPTYQSVVSNTANMARVDKKSVKQYSNVLNEDELHPENVQFIQQVLQWVLNLNFMIFDRFICMFSKSLLDFKIKYLYMEASLKRLMQE